MIEAVPSPRPPRRRCRTPRVRAGPTRGRGSDRGSRRGVQQPIARTMSGDDRRHSDEGVEERGCGHADGHRWPASVPRHVESTVEPAATTSVLNMPRRGPCSFSNKTPYHCVEKPVHAEWQRRLVEGHHHQHQRPARTGTTYVNQKRNHGSTRTYASGCASVRRETYACKTSRPIRATISDDGKHRAERPVACLEELSRMRLPTIDRLSAAEQLGDDEVADARHEHEDAADEHARQRERQGHGDEAFAATSHRGWRRPRAARGRVARSMRTAAGS